MIKKKKKKYGAESSEQGLIKFPSYISLAYLRML
jgi:hypothetical protein